MEIYQLAREMSAIAWEIYKVLKPEIRFKIGGQFIESADSVGANIAEGYGRFHYLEKVKFYHNSRGSLYETIHWLELLKERDLIDLSLFNSFKNKSTQLSPKLNACIKSNLEVKYNK